MLEQEQQFVNRALDETKHSIRKIADESQRQMSHATQIVSDTQRQAIQATREIADICVDTQKEINKSIGLVSDPKVWNNCIYPERMGEAYSRMVGTYADNAIAATKVFNNMVFAIIELSKSSIKHTTEYNKEISKIGAKNFSTAVKSISS
jgi:hypothetical protein